MKFKSILIVTYARSGSTLLQGIINSIDGVLIRGENKNFIYGLYQAYVRLQMVQNICGNNNSDSFSTKKSFTPQHPWYGGDKISLSVFLEYCTAMIKDILIANHPDAEHIICYGFKEIRYYELLKLKIELKDYLDFMQLVFPQVAIIFNTRNLDDVIKSAIWREKDKYQSIARLMKLEQDFKSYNKAYPENTFSLTYEDVISKSENFKSLFDFLGCEYSSAKIDNVLSIPHSVKNKSINIVDGKVIKGDR